MQLGIRISETVNVPPEFELLFLSEKDNDSGWGIPKVPVVVEKRPAFNGKGISRVWIDKDQENNPVVYFSFWNKMG